MHLCSKSTKSTLLYQCIKIASNVFFVFESATNSGSSFWPVFVSQCPMHISLENVIPLPVTNWASEKEKIIPNYSVEIIIFFILWSQHPYYDFNIHIMISTSILWFQHPYYDLNVKFLHHHHCNDTIIIALIPSSLQWHHHHCIDTIIIAMTPSSL